MLEGREFSSVQIGMQFPANFSETRTVFRKQGRGNKVKRDRKKKKEESQKDQKENINKKRELSLVVR